MTIGKRLIFLFFFFIPLKILYFGLIVQIDIVMELLFLRNNYYVIWLCFSLIGKGKGKGNFSLSEIAISISYSLK